MKSLLRTFFRSLLESFPRFLSIFLISLLGVGFFAGINTVEPVMVDSAQKYFDANNLSDLTIFTPLPLAEEEVIALRADPAIKEVNASRFTDVYLRDGEYNHPIRFFRMPPGRKDALDLLELVEGRFPEQPQEVVLDANITMPELQKYGIGSTIRVLEPSVETTGHELSHTSYEVVGRVNSPLYLTYERDATILGSGSIAANVYGLPGAFLGEKTNYLRLRMTELDGLSFDSAGFETRSKVCRDDLDRRGEAIYAAKTKDLRERLERQRALLETEKEKGIEALAAADAEIKAAREELEAAQTELDEGLSKGEAEIKAAEERLDLAREELRQGEEALSSGEMEAARGEAEYIAGGLELAMGRSELSRAWQTLSLSRRTMNHFADLIDENESKRAQMDLDRVWLTQVLEGLPAPVDREYLDALAEVIGIYSGVGAEQLRNLDPDSLTAPYGVTSVIHATIALMDTYAVQWSYAADELLPMYQLALEEYETHKAQYEAGLAAYQKGAADYQAAGRRLAEARAELRLASSKIVDGKLEIRDGEAEVEKGRETLANKALEGQTEIDAGWAALEDAEGLLMTERNKAEEKVRAAEKVLEEVERSIAELPDTWFVYRNLDVPGFAGYSSDAERIGAVGKIFPLFFFLVAALVCLTTMTRMIEEERLHIGLLRSLGYGRAASAFKYIAYALLATVSGAVAGGYLGLWTFPSVITWAYNILYTIPGFHLQFQNKYLTLSVLLQVLITLCVTVIALLHTLKSVPATLLLPKAPRPGKRILLERIKPLWNRLSFAQKLTVRNIFRYKIRSSMTVIGIAGCTALLLAGLGIGNSINDILRIQAGEIWNYDMLITYAMGRETEGTKREVEELIDESVLEMECLASLTKPARIRSPENKIVPVNWMIYAPPETAGMEPFIKLADRLSGAPQIPQEDGIVITEKLAAISHITLGDELEWMDVDGRIYHARVTGIAENYVEHYLFMSDQSYEKVTRQDFEANVWLLRSIGGPEASSREEVKAAVQDLSRELAGKEGILLVKLMDDLIDAIDRMLEPIGLVVVVIVATAALLAFVVLYNLVSININERKREIATIKVLGFFHREVSNYVFSEIFVLTICASLIGLALGVVLHNYIVLTVETDNMMFGRMIHPLSYILAFLLTQVFTFFVAFTMHYRLQKIDMVDSLKSLE